jgi:hypothetical protein
VRRKACRGELPVSLPEKIEILAVLAADANPETRDAALRTLEGWPSAELQAVLSDPAAPACVLQVSAMEVALDRADLVDALLRNPRLPAELRDWLESTATLFREAEAAEFPQTPIPVPVEEDDGGASHAAEPRKRETILQRINHMTAAQKIKTALTGNQEERLLLIRDPNKLVARAVLQSPKLNSHEIENIASMKNVSEEVLRLVAMNRKFMKSYGVVRSLVNNPRVPIDVGVPLLNRVNDRDLKMLALNRNVADVIRHLAEKMVKQRKEANKVNLTGKH